MSSAISVRDPASVRHPRPPYASPTCVTLGEYELLTRSPSRFYRRLVVRETHVARTSFLRRGRGNFKLWLVEAVLDDEPLSLQAGDEYFWPLGRTRVRRLRCLFRPGAHESLRVPDIRGFGLMAYWRGESGAGRRRRGPRPSVSCACPRGTGAKSFLSFPAL